MSCGQIALTELGMFPDKYYASEIDKHAIKQTQLNFPDTVQMGDVTMWMDWDIDWKSIDLILAGSPCQGFSFAGKQLAFDDPRSVLFFEFVAIRDYVRSLNPNVKFLLENVRMKKEHMAVITEYMGVDPININSNLVSAQNRNRFYWTNISGVDIPEDRGIFLKDVLETDVDDKYYLSETTLLGMIERKQKCLERKSGFGMSFVGDKSGPLATKADRGTNLVLTDRQNGMNLVIGEATKKGFTEIYPGECFDYSYPNSKTRRGRNMADKCNCLMAQPSTEYFKYEGRQKIRRLTPTEFSRLQTVPDWYRWECSDTQQYKMCGNGWTVEVIKHILKNLDV